MSLDVNVRMQSIRVIEEWSVSHPWMKMQMRFFWVWTKPLWASDLHSELSSVHGSMSSHYALCYPRLPRRFQTSSLYHVQSLFLFNATLSFLACSILKDCFKIASVSSENTVPRDAFVPNSPWVSMYSLAAVEERAFIVAAGLVLVSATRWESNFPVSWSFSLSSSGPLGAGGL